MSREILAIIPARGGSKGIPRKNLLKIEGKPLIQYTLEAAKKSHLITRAIVNSDDEEILAYAKTQGGEIYQRPPELGEDTTSMRAVIEEQLNYLRNKEGYEPDIIVLLQPTSPLRNANHIDEALEIFDNMECESVVSVEEEPHLHSPYSVMRINEEGYLEFFLKGGQDFTSRQQKPKFYARNGAAIYAVKTEIFMKTGSFYGEKCLPYLMLPEDSVDIDTMLDVYVVQAMMRYKKDKESSIGKEN